MIAANKKEGYEPSFLLPTLLNGAANAGFALTPAASSACGIQSEKGIYFEGNQSVPLFHLASSVFS
ncbi:hypothetical protein [Pseudomonas sp. MWU12-2029]|uniref:hypothetical protein n=1 Tax=Pseudomonas sp. MWU12-2029 TaxID=2927805 RepID=UPI0020108C05|nr:hypothetical protein [Pseudomonas sp. MWU12-2029]